MKNIMKKSKKINLLTNNLEYLKLHSKEIVVWRIVNEKKIISEAKVKLIRKYRQEVVLSVNLNQDLYNILSGSEVVNVFLPDNGVIFQSKIKSFVENAELVIMLPSEFAQLERRKNMRYAPENEEISCFIGVIDKNLKKINFKKNLLDISAGGASFVCSKDESKLFKLGDELECIVSLNDKYVKLRAKIVNVIHVDPAVFTSYCYGGWKSSVCFIDHGEDIKRMINNYIFKQVKDIGIGS
jgi:c-di-GMP-binding flagellar brake protein YcgR